MSRVKQIQELMLSPGRRVTSRRADGSPQSWSYSPRDEELDIEKAHVLALMDLTEAITKLSEENG